MTDVQLNKVLWFDTETHSADRRWDMEPQDFFRLGQYAWGRDGEVQLTADYDEMISVVREADRVIGHNIHNFDLSTLFGKHSTEPLEMAQQNKVFDTMVHANLVYPAPYSYTNREGHTFFNAAEPDKAKSWFSLDNLSFQLGLPGKIGSLRDLAKKYNPEKTLIKDLDYSLIPLDDPDFIQYAVQDVVAVRDLSIKLLDLGPIDDYAWREQLSIAILAQISRNGFKVDTEAAMARVEELRVRREELMNDFVEKYDFPTAGKSPWASNAGKEAILNALAGYGITPQNTPDWPKTKTGTISLGGKEIMGITNGTGAEEFGEVIAELKGQRSLAQLALDSQHADGFAHPDISAFQRSGRFSVTKPGLTIWTARGPGAIEKRYFIAEEGHKIVEFDYSNADARIVAAYSGDENYKERFKPGMDGHEINGRIVFGDDYDTDPRKYRDLAKALGHAFAYRAGAKKLAETSKQPIEIAYQFISQMNGAYPKVLLWQERATESGKRGYIDNAWGRRMPVEADRSYNQSPALLGQSGTTEIMKDALIRMLDNDIRLIKWCRVPVHDALVFSIPEESLSWAIPGIRDLMFTTWHPGDKLGQEIDFPVENGEPSNNWYEASHG